MSIFAAIGARVRRLLSAGRPYASSRRAPVLEAREDALPLVERPPAVAPSEYSYRESLYASRRVLCSNPRNPGYALQQLKNIMFQDRTVELVRQRRRFIKPKVKRMQALFAARKRRFNKIVGSTVARLMSYHEKARRQPAAG